MNIDKLAWVIVGAVVISWFVTTLILPIVVPGYTQPPSVGVTMGSMAGGAAAYLFAKRTDRNGNGKNGKNGNGQSKK